MARFLGIQKRKYCYTTGLLLFWCILLLFLNYKSAKKISCLLPEESLKRSNITCYKHQYEREIFSSNTDSNSSVQVKTFFNTILHPPGVILKSGNGIGNQLFRYACTYALAKDLGWPLYLLFKDIPSKPRNFQSTQREFALDQFQIQFENIIDNTTRFSIPVSQENDQTFLQRTFLKKPNPQNQFVGTDSSCQSIEYWKNYQEEIKVMFQPRKSAIDLSKLKKVIDEISSSGESVAVHVRRGDFTGIRGFFIPISYQRYAMRKMINILKARGKEKPVFFVFSDDIAHVEKKLKDFAETYELVFVPREISHSTSIEDFYLMTLCRHIIIPNSTYSWWAAYLIKNKKKIVIASEYNPGFLNDLRRPSFHGELRGKMYHPKDWIVINPFTGGLVRNLHES